MLRVIALAVVLGLAGCVNTPYEISVSWSASAPRLDAIVRVWHPSGVTDTPAGAGTTTVSGETSDTDIEICAQVGYIEGGRYHPLGGRDCDWLTADDYAVELTLD
jgi:hypothetical protein